MIPDRILYLAVVVVVLMAAAMITMEHLRTTCYMQDLDTHLKVNVRYDLLRGCEYQSPYSGLWYSMKDSRHAHR